MIQLHYHIRNIVAVTLVFISYGSIAQDDHYFIIVDETRDSIRKDNFFGTDIFSKDLAQRTDLLTFLVDMSQRMGNQGTKVNTQFTSHGLYSFGVLSKNFDRGFNITLSENQDSTGSRLKEIFESDAKTDGYVSIIKKHDNGSIYLIARRENMPINNKTKYIYYDFVQIFDQTGQIVFQRTIDRNGNGEEVVYNQGQVTGRIQYLEYDHQSTLGDIEPKFMGPYYLGALPHFQRTGIWP